jgi:hypothetical protein
LPLPTKPDEADGTLQHAQALRGFDPRPPKPKAQIALESRRGFPQPAARARARDAPMSSLYRTLARGRGASAAGRGAGGG